jgi:hypothetical protein
MGIARKGLNNRHKVYAANQNGLRLLAPAILFLKALFKPNATVFQYLFRPSGLDMLLAPVSTHGSVSVALIPSRLRQHVPIAHRGLARLQWLYCFPSARMAYDSVYAHAACGTIGLTLPNIEASVSVKGLLPGETLMVSSRRLTRSAPWKRLLSGLDFSHMNLLCPDAVRQRTSTPF